MTSAGKPDPIPARYRRVTPCLIVRGGDKALEFYAEVFGATERMRFPGPDGSVAHAEIEIGDSVVIVEEQSPYMGTQAPPAGGCRARRCSSSSTSSDVDAVVDSAVEARRDALARAARTSSTATATAYIVDPFGHGWTVASHVEDVAPDELTAADGRAAGLGGRGEVRAVVRGNREFAAELEAMSQPERERAYEQGRRVARRPTPTRSVAATSCRAPDTATTVRLDRGEAGHHRRAVRRGQGGRQRLQRDRGRRPRRGAANGQDLAGLPDRRDTPGGV